MNGISFPGLGIKFGYVPSSIYIFGIEIKLYAVVITLGFFLALLISGREAKKSGQNPEDYLDFFLWMVVPCILGARLYYIIFNWKEYFIKGRGFKETLMDLINIKGGGLAIYGGLIAGAIVAFIFNKKRKLSLPLMGDTVCMGVLIGQILGRTGNFFNREVFGEYTSSFIRMALPIDYFANDKYDTYDMYIESGIISRKMIENPEIINGQKCITVYPTFLFEALWNLAILIFIFLYRRKKKYDGELALIYIMGYGLGRFWIEGIRTDTLMIGPFKISQVVAFICFFGALGVMIYNRKRIAGGKELPCHRIKVEEKATETENN